MNSMKSDRVFSRRH